MSFSDPHGTDMPPWEEEEMTLVENAGSGPALDPGASHPPQWDTAQHHVGRCTEDRAVPLYSATRLFLAKQKLFPDSRYFLCERFLEHWKLVIGATQLSRRGPDSLERSIKNLVEHEQYRHGATLNDIALMEMDEPVNCSDYIQPACLPDENVEVAALSHCYVSGWGITDVKSKKSELCVPRALTGSPEHMTLLQGLLQSQTEGPFSPF